MRMKGVPTFAPLRCALLPGGWPWGFAVNSPLCVCNSSGQPLWPQPTAAPATDSRMWFRILCWSLDKQAARAVIGAGSMDARVEAQLALCRNRITCASFCSLLCGAS